MADSKKTPKAEVATSPRRKSRRQPPLKQKRQGCAAEALQKRPRQSSGAGAAPADAARAGKAEKKPKAEKAEAKPAEKPRGKICPSTAPMTKNRRS